MWTHLNQVHLHYWVEHHRALAGWPEYWEDVLIVGSFW